MRYKEKTNRVLKLVSPNCLRSRPLLLIQTLHILTRYPGLHGMNNLLANEGPQP